MQVQTRLPQVGTTIFSVMSALAVQHRALNLGQGFPDFDPPAELIEAMAQAARDGKNQYAPMPGILPLRQAIAEKVQREYGATVDPDTDITVMAGASQAIFNTVLGLVHPGDEVIVLDPCYDCYDPAITLAGARAVHVPLDPKTFAVDWDRVRAAVTPKTRMLFVNSPHNPTGALFDERDIEELTRTVHQTGIIVLSDEVYEHIVFDGRQHLSVLRYPELAARSVVISSFGKTYHCTGWKIGYAVAPKVLSVEVQKVHQYNSFCTFAPAQHGLALMLRDHPEHHQGLGAFYQAKRDRFAQMLQQTRLGVLPVLGGYFQLVDYSAVSDLDDLAFARWLTIEHGVTTIPLSPFYAEPPKGQRLARLCFAKSDATQIGAVERLSRL